MSSKRLLNTIFWLDKNTIDPLTIPELKQIKSINNQEKLLNKITNIYNIKIADYERKIEIAKTRIIDYDNSVPLIIYLDQLKENVELINLRYENYLKYV